MMRLPASWSPKESFGSGSRTRRRGIADRYDRLPCQWRCSPDSSRTGSASGEDPLVFAEARFLRDVARSPHPKPPRRQVASGPLWRSSSGRSTVAKRRRAC